MRPPVGNSQSNVRMQRTAGWIQFSFNSTTRNILGGITRRRFKGFDRRFAPIISAMRLPPHRFSFGMRLACAKLTTCKIAGRSVMDGLQTWSLTVARRLKRRKLSDYN